LAAKTVSVYWIKKQTRELEVFASIANSFVPNPPRKSLRFKVRKVNGYNDTYDVIVRVVRGYHRYKAEWYEDPAEEHELLAMDLDRGLELYDNDDADLILLEMSW